MTRYNDISNAHAQLEGEGWHIEHHKESIVVLNSKKTKKKHIATKRDKRRCIYYNKKNKHCYKLKCICMGSSDCISYRD